MYRIVASDMDETFLDGNHRIPAGNAEALRRLKEAGVLFVPSSGRPYASIMGNFRDIGPSLMEGSYVISYNGAFINRFGDPEPIVSAGMDLSLARELYLEGRELGLCVHVYTPSGLVYTCDEPESERRYLSALTRIRHFDSAAFDDLSFTGGEGVVKVIYMSDDFAGLKRLGAEIAPGLTERGCSVTYSSGRYLELMPAGIDKGAGLARLAGMLGVDMADTIGMGDSANDREMIEAAGLGVGVANATEDLRPFCDVVLDSASNDGALAEVFDRFIQPTL